MPQSVDRQEELGSAKLLTPESFYDCPRDNNLQTTDRFWQDVKDSVGKHDKPGRFVALAVYEWSSNTDMGGDRDVNFSSEGRPLRRSSRVLKHPQEQENTDCATVAEYFETVESEGRLGP